MKKLLVIFFMLIIHAVNAMQDPLLDRKVTLTLNSVTLDRALEQLALVVRVKFMYSSDQVNLTERVSLDVNDKFLRDVLEELLTPLGIVYKTHTSESTITLRKQNLQQSSAIIPTSEVVALITGYVRNSSGEPMAGVSVFIKGTSRGTITDSQGQFTLDALQGDMLSFSFIGFKPYEVRIGNEAELSIVLTEEASRLNEVIVNAGYWEVTRAEQTGNIARVTAAEIDKQPVSNPLLALQGRMAGVVVQQISGVPGAGIQLQVRGQNSLRNLMGNNGNYPLIVIDGVQVESAPLTSGSTLLSVSGIDPLNTLNPANIESIEVLKDADATAIYGSRGANGVVLITTKKGKPGNLSLDVNAYTSVGEASSRMKLMNTQQYLAMRNEAFELDGVTPGASDFDLNGTWSQTRNTDWQKKLFGETAKFQDVQLSLSGGSAETSFRMGTGMHHESTVFPGSFGYTKMMGNLNVNHTSPDQRINLSFTVNYGLDNNDLFNRNIVADALALAPTAPLYHDDGTLDWTGYTGSTQNPFSYFKISHTSRTSSLLGNARISAELFKGLRIATSFGFTDGATKQVINTPQVSMNPNNLSDSRSSLMDQRSTSWIAEPQLSWRGQVFQGRLDVLLGTTFQSRTTETFGVEGSGFVSDALLGNIRGARTIVINTDEESEYRYAAAFGRIGYIYKERYLINLTARRDGSSRFGSDSKFGTFAAAGAAWIFSEENFIKNSLKFLSFGKLRASYGTTGSDQIGNYGYASTYSPITETYNGTSVIVSNGLANPDFGWEINRKLEVASDLGFIDDRIRLSVSAYRNRSSNQLVGYPLSAVTGFASVQYNLAATVQNTGCEIELNTVNLRQGSWNWSTSFNLTVPRNKLIEYPGLRYSSYNNTYVVGEPLTISKRYYMPGVDPTTGLYTVTDVDASGTINVSDRQSIVNLGRTLYGGMGNNIRYGNVELSFFFEFVKQQSNDYFTLFSDTPGTLANQPAFILEGNRWHAPGDDATLQRFTQSQRTPYSRMLLSDFNATDASFLRLKTVSLTWQLPAAWLSKIKLRDLRVYAQGQNLLTITRYEGLNPEFAFQQLPPLRTLTFGIQLKL